MTTATSTATNADTWLTLEQAAAYCGVRVRGRPTHPDTVYTWIKHGLRGVRLRAVNRGARLCTRAEWIEQFWEDYTAAIEGARQNVQAAVPESPAARNRRYARAEAANRKAGIA